MVEDKKSPSPCPECGAERIEADVKDSQSGSLILKQAGKLLGAKSSVMALVCTGCGYTAFYAATPLKLVIKRPDKPPKERE